MPLPTSPANSHWAAPDRRQRRQRGFGVLEALIALMLLSGVGFTLLSWIQQNLDTMQRLRGFYEKVETQKTILEWSRALNPMERPDGEVTLGALRLVWKATPLAAPVPQAGEFSGPGVHDLALYDVKVDAFRSGELQPWLVQNIVCVGYRKARDNRKVPI